MQMVGIQMVVIQMVVGFLLIVFGACLTAFAG